MYSLFIIVLVLNLSDFLNVLSRRIQSKLDALPSQYCSFIPNTIPIRLTTACELYLSPTLLLCTYLPTESIEEIKIPATC